MCFQDYVDAAVQQAIAIHVGFRPKLMGEICSVHSLLVPDASLESSLVRVTPEVRRLVMLLPQILNAVYNFSSVKWMNGLSNES